MQIAISIRQPWAALIVLGFKDIENRSWEPPARYLGETIAIHAGAQPDREALEHPRQQIKAAAARLAACCGVPEVNFNHMAYHFPEAFKMGGIVGRAIIHSATKGTNLSPWASRLPGTWHWHMVAGMTSTFAPCRGQLGFFKPSFPAPASSRSAQTRQASFLD